MHTVASAWLVERADDQNPTQRCRARLRVLFVCTWHELAGGGVVGVVAREVNPLGVAELVAHEVEVALAAQRQRHLHLQQT